MESAIYIVATPIGNLSDITLRALDTLKNVDLVAAEDTRHSKKLLAYHDVDTAIISLHEHNEREKSQKLIEEVQSGKSIALISDAGTPLISDPGYVLVSEAKKQGVSVIPIPGASALITALCASGMPSDRFVFEGFVPVKQKARSDFFESLVMESRTLIFYESPRRVLDSLKEMLRIFGDREACFARELTKQYETIRKGVLSELICLVGEDEYQQKGEFVLMLAGLKDQSLSVDEQAKRKLLMLLLAELPPKKASAIVAEIYSCSKKEVYDLVLSLKE